jgi:hypothetical protein
LFFFFLSFVGFCIFDWILECELTKSIFFVVVVIRVFFFFFGFFVGGVGFLLLLFFFYTLCCGVLEIVFCRGLFSTSNVRCFVELFFVVSLDQQDVVFACGFW